MATLNIELQGEPEEIFKNFDDEAFEAKHAKAEAVLGYGKAETEYIGEQKSCRKDSVERYQGWKGV